ncbi:hypothetical protein QOZ80_2AG0148460 [Eleusine coracana subsp. coracana]|nr:hypothetical protein QOZ80_2AG0148460 [Eleusine coracana subsp. coracana]
MGRHASPSSSSFLLRLVLAALVWCHASLVVVTAQQNGQVRVGVILAPPVGTRRRVGIEMAVEDYYATHPRSAARIALRFRDSGGDVLTAASAAVDLIKNEQVQAIIGPVTSAETQFVAHIGSHTHVPIISTATSPELSPAQTPFYVRAAVNDSVQAAPIAAVLAEFQWHAAVVVYEDSPYGAGILPAMADALQGVGARISDRAAVPLHASDDRIDKILNRFMAMPTRVFVVHMSPFLAARFFQRARHAGMMSRDYAWIASAGVGSYADLLPREDVDAMEGVVSVRPYVEMTEQVRNFSARFRARLRREFPNDDDEVVFHDPTVMILWAYDTVWAIAKAVEAAGISNNPVFQTPPRRSGGVASTDLDRLGVLVTGKTFLDAVRATTFRGLAGNFTLVDGQLQLPAYEIVNIVGKGARTVGFWTPESGISQTLNNNVSGGAKELKHIIWPGDSSNSPKGWVVSPNGDKLRVFVPVKYGFKQFVDVGNESSTTDDANVTGHCIDVFDEVMRNMPYPVSYQYVPYEPSAESYEYLVAQVVEKNADIVVGDVTVTASRMDKVDFTMPFTESGWSMVVPVQKDTSTSMWIFLKPLTTSLWLASLAFFIFTGFVVWVIEHRINEEFRGTPWQQFGLIFYFSFSTLVFSHKEKLESNLSRFVVIIWVFVVLILTSSYTASLTSMLTVQKLQPTVTDIRELQRRGDYIGFQDGSFIEGSLMKMGFDRSRMKNYSTTEQYAEALSKGPANGGVAAVFDEIPYLKVFLSQSQYCDGYTMVGPIYKTDGFGFVFPRGSPMTADVSRQVLKLAEGDKMTQIEKKWLGEPGVCQRQDGNAALGSSNLSFQSFGGLFLITGVVSGLMLLIFLASFFYRERNELRAEEVAAGFGSGSGSPSLRRLRAWMRHYDRRDPRSPTFKTWNDGSVRSGNQSPRWMDDTVRGGRDANRGVQAATEVDATGMSPFSISTRSEMNAGSSPAPEPQTSFEQRMEEAAVPVEMPRSTSQRQT